MDLNNILKKINEQGIFQQVKRYTYNNFEMPSCLQVIEAIGKQRNPKFVIDEENRFAYENLVRWVFADPNFKCLDPVTRNVIPGRLNSGIYLAGNTGSGKSWALEIMAAFCTVDNVQVALGGKSRCLRWPSFRVDTICDEYIETGKIEKYKRMPIVAFQDLGAEPLESLYMGNRVQVMRQIIEYRGDQTDQITLISSNFSMAGEKLSKAYDVRVASRLNELCNYLEIKGKDRRKL